MSLCPRLRPPGSEVSHGRHAVATHLYTTPSGQRRTPWGSVRPAHTTLLGQQNSPLGTSCWTVASPAPCKRVSDLLPGPSCCSSRRCCLLPPPPEERYSTQLEALCISELHPGVHILPLSGAQLQIPANTPSSVVSTTTKTSFMVPVNQHGAHGPWLRAQPQVSPNVTGRA